MKRLHPLIVFILFFFNPVTAISFDGNLRLLINREYYTVLEEKIRGARDEIIVSTYIFRTTDNPENLATRVATLLTAAAKRGVNVTVVLEKEKRERKGSTLNIDNSRTARLLEKGGVKVLYDSPDVVTHSKMIVVDGRFVFIGSHNLTDSALRWNNELSVMIESPDEARKVINYIREIRR